VIVSIPVLHKGNVYGFINDICVDNDAALLGKFFGDLVPTSVTKGARLFSVAAPGKHHASTATSLPFHGLLAAFILRGDMHTKSEEWVLLEDLKKNRTK
jgi:hypothetical protein